MARPVEVLAAARGLLAPGGAVLVADERTADVFTAPGDEMERTLYAYSVVCCLPCGLCRRAVRRHGHDAPTRRVRGDGPRRRLLALDVLPTEHEQFRFYRLDP